ncbi:PAS domain S-box protein [Aureimonas jatrophae]|uniref:PAS domain S-box protein n=1 Tax=Aureimonas jatrophae TaxID=1166073 RepID=UPI0017DA51C3|nr:PAS domain-containing protein [Aureimonas jatrophae]MBB3951317.1 PAS domain S-box-containing protein [Aureimonas jatrophae]
MTDTLQSRFDETLGPEGAAGDPFAAAVRATRMPMVITDPRQADNPIVFANRAFMKLTGYERDEIVGRNCRFLQCMETNRDDVGRIRDAITRREPIEIEILNAKRSGETFWNRVYISPVFDAGEVMFFFASQLDVTQQRRTLQILENERATLEREVDRRLEEQRQNEERLRFALRAGRLGAWTLDLPSGRLTVSEEARRIFGVAADAPFDGASFRDALVPADRTDWDDALERSTARGGDLDIVLSLRHPDGRRRWIEVRGQPSHRADGEVLGFAGVLQDVTERVRAERHGKLMTKELNHRVKNTLATVISIVGQTLRATEDRDEALGLVNSRILALSNVHNVLTDENWEGVALSQVVEVTTKAFGGGPRNRVSMSGPPVRLRPRSALAIALALHELATNAAKYGALSPAGGSVAVAWHIVDDETLHLTWRESSNEPVTPPTRRGFGLRLIERALVAETEGSAHLEWPAEGLVFEMTAPLSVVADPDDA